MLKWLGGYFKKGGDFIKNSKKFFILIGFISVLCFSGSYFNPVSADQVGMEQNRLTSEEISSLKSFFNEYGVEIETQNRLIEKLLNGEKWDSLLNKQPVNTYQINTDSKVENVSVFEDGSIIVTGTDLFEAEIVTNENLITPFAIAPGTIVKGSGYAIYYDAKIYVTVGIITAYFYADYELTQGGLSRIIALGGAYRVSASIGSISQSPPTIVRKTETRYQAAEAILVWQYTGPWNLGSTTSWLKLELKDSKATTTHDI